MRNWEPVRGRHWVQFSASQQTSSCIVEQLETMKRGLVQLPIMTTSVLFNLKTEAIHCLTSAAVSLSLLSKADRCKSRGCSVRTWSQWQHVDCNQGRTQTRALRCTRSSSGYKQSSDSSSLTKMRAGPRVFTLRTRPPELTCATAR